MQSFPGNVVHFLSICFKDWSPFEMGKHVTVLKWSIKWQERPYGLEMETLLAVKCKALWVALKKLVINHLQAGTGIFAARLFAKGVIVGWYYGSLVYESMTQREQTTKKYGKAFMQGTQETFPKCASRISEAVKY